jgi:hypothetical protein
MMAIAMVTMAVIMMTCISSAHPFSQSTTLLYHSCATVQTLPGRKKTTLFPHFHHTLA